MVLIISRSSGISKLHLTKASHALFVHLLEMIYHYFKWGHSH